MIGWRQVLFEEGTNRLRSGWRLLLFLLMAVPMAETVRVMLVWVTAVVFGGQLPIPLQDKVIEAVALTTVFIGASIVALGMFDRLPASTLGLRFRGGWLWMLLGGFLIGIVPIVLYVVTVDAAGLAALQWRAVGGRDLQLLALSIVGWLLFAAEEEIIYRGYLFQTLLRGIGPVAALLLTSAMFAAMHLGNPNVSHFGLANIFLAGVMFGMIYLRAGSLWLPIGLHAGWNFAQFFFSLPVSGNTLDIVSPLAIRVTERQAVTWVTGGAFGPEGGAVVTVLLLAMTGILVFSHRGLPLASRWWEWRDLVTVPPSPPLWDFSIGSRHYQWRLQTRDNPD